MLMKKRPEVLKLQNPECLSPSFCIEMHPKSQKNHSHEEQGQAKQNSFSTFQALARFLISFLSYCRIHLG